MVYLAQASVCSVMVVAECHKDRLSKLPDLSLREGIEEEKVCSLEAVAELHGLREVLSLVDTDPAEEDQLMEVVLATEEELGSEGESTSEKTLRLK